MRFQRTVLGLVGALLTACGSSGVSTASDTSAPSTSGGTTAGAVPGFFSRFTSQVTVTVSGTEVTLRSNALPQHQSRRAHRQQGGNAPEEMRRHFGIKTKHTATKKPKR